MMQSGAQRQWWMLERLNGAGTLIRAGCGTLHERFEVMLEKLELELERARKDVQQATQERADWDAHLQQQRRREEADQLE
eukprot:5482451-Prymnesium_polylepis.1